MPGRFWGAESSQGSLKKHHTKKDQQPSDQDLEFGRYFHHAD
jgi:hypothetical protein